MPSSSIQAVLDTLTREDAVHHFPQPKLLNERLSEARNDWEVAARTSDCHQGH